MQIPLLELIAACGGRNALKQKRGQSFCVHGCIKSLVFLSW
jgi:hypothetical protein